MEKPRLYRLEDIKKYWNVYWKTSGHRYLIKGKWQYDFTGKPLGLINATKAEVTLLRNQMTFPEFLEKYGK